MKKIKGSLLFLTMFLFLFNFKAVHALETNSSKVVNKDKVWTVKFNKFIKLDQNTLSSITVKDSENNVIPTTLQLDKNGKTVLVLPPKDGYNETKSYTLTIGKNLKDTKGRLLNNDTNLNFTIKSIPSIDNTKLGATIGNSVNNSWVAQDENSLYFLCSNYMDAVAIYKTDKATGKSTKLSEADDFQNLNVLNNKLYYTKTERNPDYNWQDHNDAIEEYIPNLYVMDTDGKNIKKILSNVSKYVVTENYIYFINTSDKNKLYRCDLAGGNKTKLTNEAISSFNIYGDKIVYTNVHGTYTQFILGSQYGNIYVMNLDGSSTKKLTSNEAFSVISQKDGIYYINKSDNNTIYKVSLDGKNQKVSNIPASAMNIDNGTIYYKNLSDTITTITIPVGMDRHPVKLPTVYKMNLNGTSNTKLLSKYCVSINALNGKLYYEEYYDNGSMSGSLRHVYTDGTKDPLVSDSINH